MKWWVFNKANERMLAVLLNESKYQLSFNNGGELPYVDMVESHLICKNRERCSINYFIPYLLIAL